MIENHTLIPRDELLGCLDNLLQEYYVVNSNNIWMVALVANHPDLIKEYFSNVSIQAVERVIKDRLKRMESFGWVGVWYSDD